MNPKKEEEVKSKIYVKALNYVSYRLRSEKDITDKIHKLVREEKIDPIISEETFKYVYLRLSDEGYINDTKLVESYIDEVSRNNKKSLKEAKKFLISKGVDSSVIDSSIDNTDDDFEVETIKKLITKKLRSLDKFRDYEKKRKIISYLLGKGFNYQSILNVFDSWPNLQ